MARFMLVALCVTATFQGALAASALSYGMTMTSRAFDAVCWYETLKIFPNTDSRQFGQCIGQTKQTQKQIEEPNEQNKAYFDSDPDNALTTFGDWMSLDSLPNADHYHTQCDKYRKDYKAEPASDESDALNDKYKKSYPYKALAYCLMSALRDKHGEKAIEAVKMEKTHSLKHWRTTLLDRENEFRKRHGVEPLQMVKDLNDAAQEWSDDNAKKCDSYHTENSDPRRQWHGALTGESLSAGGGDDVSANFALMAADGWYEEIKDYPFPGGFDGNDDDLFLKIGHFTASVWKGTKYVGYGYTYNKDCSPYTGYITARYSPGGNMPGAYQENVLPVQE